MRSFIRLVTALLIYTASPAADPLTPGEFTDAYAARLEKLDTAVSVQYVRELEIGYVNAKRNEQTVFLDNAYRDYSRDTDSLEAILDRYVKATCDADRSDVFSRIDVNRIVPVIKDAAYALASVAPKGKSGQEDFRQEFYHEPLNRELHIYYAHDTDSSVRYLSREEIAALGMGPDRLKEKAVSNLTNILPGIERRGEAGTYMVTAGGTYEASLLLFDAIWTKENFDVKGDIVIAVPRRDLLLVTGSEDENGLKTLDKLAELAVSEANHTVTSRLFVRKNGDWLPFEIADNLQ